MPDDAPARALPETMPATESLPSYLDITDAGFSCLMAREAGLIAYYLQRRDPDAAAHFRSDFYTHLTKAVAKLGGRIVWPSSPGMSPAAAAGTDSPQLRPQRPGDAPWPDVSRKPGGARLMEER